MGEFLHQQGPLQGLTHRNGSGRAGIQACASLFGPQRCIPSLHNFPRLVKVCHHPLDRSLSAFLLRRFSS